jgi:hypothetical protein
MNYLNHPDQLAVVTEVNEDGGEDDDEDIDELIDDEADALNVVYRGDDGPAEVLLFWRRRAVARNGPGHASVQLR